MSRHLAHVGLTTVLFLTLAALAGCGILGPDITRYVVEVDSVSAPAAVAPGEGFTARFHGTIGSDLCHSLERVERVREDDALTIRFHGIERRDPGTDCAHAISILDHEERVAPPVDRPFTLEVLQPDGSTLEEVVRAE